MAVRDRAGGPPGRVTHTFGPMSPLASREPIFFARLAAGRPILVPGDGLAFVHLVHVADVATCMAQIAGNRRTIGQLYNVAGHEITSVLGQTHQGVELVVVDDGSTDESADIARSYGERLVFVSQPSSGAANEMFPLALMLGGENALSDPNTVPAGRPALAGTGSSCMATTRTLPGVPNQTA